MLSAEFHDRLVTMLVDCLDDDEEPGVILESVGLESLKEALRKHLPDKSIPAEAVDWLIKAYCDVIEGIWTFICFIFDCYCITVARCFVRSSKPFGLVKMWPEFPIISSI